MSACRPVPHWPGEGRDCETCSSTTTIKGLRFVVEGTGGGCTALVCRTEAGVFVLTDGNLTADVWDAPDGVDACLYVGTAWDDGDDAAAYVSAETPALAVAALEDMARMVRA